MHTVPPLTEERGEITGGLKRFSSSRENRSEAIGMTTAGCAGQLAYRSIMENRTIRPAGQHISRGCPVLVSTLLQTQPVGSTFLRAETASGMGTWVKVFIQ